MRKSSNVERKKPKPTKIEKDPSADLNKTGKKKKKKKPSRVVL